MARPKGSPLELERRRRLAVSRVLDDGVSASQVALEQRVTLRAVHLWVKAARHKGLESLTPIAASGRPPKLTKEQERQVLAWLTLSPTQFGYPNELWTGARVAQQVFKHFKVKFNSNYMLQWLTERGMSSQKPQAVPRERDEQEVQRWLREEWPRIQKKPGKKTPKSS